MGTSKNLPNKADLLRKSFIINAELEIGVPGGEFIEMPLCLLFVHRGSWHTRPGQSRRGRIIP
ncbi:MAG: hypothetical protein EA402_13890 [Planctomycetota bacterium]|nr:MAG: hypothetical protein EA402_13890 [Planctomycetota bacterium]